MGEWIAWSGAILASGLAVYFQQKNRRKDQKKASDVENVRLRVEEGRTAIEGFSELAKANRENLAFLQQELTQLRGRNNDCEQRTIDLQKEMFNLQRRVLQLPDLDPRTAARVLSARLFELGLIWVDMNATIIGVSPVAERLTGYTQAELLGQSAEILVPMDVRERHRMFMAQYLRDPVIRLMGGGLNLRVRHKDGTVFPADVGLAPMRAQDGSVPIIQIALQTLASDGSTHGPS